MPTASNKSNKEPKAKPAAATTEANPAAEDDSEEPAPPMIRAQRRLEAKRKTGRSAPTRVTPNGMSAAGDTMRRQGVKGGGGTQKGTNTRRSG